VLFMGDGEAVLCSPRPAGWFGEVVERLPVSVVPLR